MRLVHGTSSKIGRASKLKGLSPRGSKKSQWKVESNSSSIYFSNAYALHYALNASMKYKTFSVSLVEIETDRIPFDQKSNFVADEDALEQAYRLTRGKLLPFKFPDNFTMEERTLWFSNNLEMCRDIGYDHNWSIRVLGNAAFMGHVPKEAITRITILTEMNKGWWLRFFDPTITIQNFMILGNQYRLVQLILMGRTDEAKELLPSDVSLDYIAWVENLVAPHRAIYYQNEHQLN